MKFSERLPLIKRLKCPGAYIRSTVYRTGRPAAMLSLHVLAAWHCTVAEEKAISACVSGRRDIAPHSPTGLGSELFSRVQAIDAERADVCLTSLRAFQPCHRRRLAGRVVPRSPRSPHYLFIARPHTAVVDFRFRPRAQCPKPLSETARFVSAKRGDECSV